MNFLKRNKKFYCGKPHIPQTTGASHSTPPLTAHPSPPISHPPVSVHSRGDVHQCVSLQIYRRRAGQLKGGQCEGLGEGSARVLPQRVGLTVTVRHLTRRLDRGDTVTVRHLTRRLGGGDTVTVRHLTG